MIHREQCFAHVVQLAVVVEVHPDPQVHVRADLFVDGEGDRDRIGAALLQHRAQAGVHIAVVGIVLDVRTGAVDGVADHLRDARHRWRIRHRSGGYTPLRFDGRCEEQKR